MGGLLRDFVRDVSDYYAVCLRSFSLKCGGGEGEQIFFRLSLQFALHPLVNHSTVASTANDALGGGDRS